MPAHEAAAQERGPRKPRPRACWLDLSKVDVVLMRQDPPFDMSYITATHILEKLQPSALVVNDPAGVRNAPEKLFVTDFEGVMPPTLITHSTEAVRTFRDEHRDIIVKPLYGNGGGGCLSHPSRGREPRISPGDVRSHVPRTDDGPGLSSRGPAGRQAHHPHRRRTGRRHQPGSSGRRVTLQHACRRPSRARGTVGEGSRDLQHHRTRTGAPRHDPRGHRCHRRLADGDQCHIADRHPGDQPLRTA